MNDGRKSPAPPTPGCGRDLSAPTVHRGERHATGRNFDNLPNVLAEIAEVVGREAALDIAYVRGGHRAHFPAEVPPNHWLIRTVGQEAADKLAKHFNVRGTAGVTVVIPLGPMRFYAEARRRAAEMRVEGTSIARIARTLGVSTRAVEMWHAQDREKPAPRLGRNEPPLFERNRPEEEAF